MTKKLQPYAILLALALLFVFPAYAEDKASVTLSAGESFSVVNTGSSSVSVSFSIPEESSSCAYFTTIYNADGSARNCAYYTRGQTFTLAAGREIIVTAESAVVCSYSTSGASAGQTSEAAVERTTVSDDSYLSVNASESTTIYFGTSSTYLSTTNSSGSFSYSIGNRSSCTAPAGGSLQLAFRDGNSHVCYWAARADVTSTVVEGPLYVEKSVPAGKTLKLQMPTTGRKVTLEQTTSAYYSILRYATADYSSVSYSASSWGSTTVNAGQTVELTALTQTSTFYYPVFFENELGMTGEILDTAPLTYQVVEPGKTIKLRMPSTGRKVTIEQKSTAYYSGLHYATADYSSVSYSASSWGSTTVNAGQTVELTALTQTSTFYYPAFFETVLGMTVEIHNDAPLTYQTVEPGNTIKLQMPTTGRNVTIEQKSSAYYSILRYGTDNYSNVSVSNRTWGDTSVNAGQTVELTALTESNTFYYPAFFEDVLGMTVETYTGSPITYVQIPAGNTLKASVPANSSNVQLSQKGYLHHTKVSYAANYTDMSFSRDTWSSSYTIKPGYTLEIMPISQASTFYYPTIFETQFGMTLDIYQGSPMVTYSLTASNALRFTWPATAAGGASIGVTRNISYDLLTYPTGQAKQTCSYDEDKDGFYLKPGYTADVSSESSSTEIYFPSVLLDAGLVVEELYSQSVFHRETVKQNETLRLTRPKLTYTLNMTLVRNAGATWDYVKYAADGTASYTDENWSGTVTLKNDEVADLTCLTESAVICVPHFWITEGLLEIDKIDAPAFSTLDLEMSAPDAGEVSLAAVEDSDSPTHSLELREGGSLERTTVMVSRTALGLGTKLNYFRVDAKTGQVTYSNSCSVGSSIPLNKGQRLILQPIDGSLQVKFPQEHVKNGDLIVDGVVQKSESLKLGAGFGPVAKVGKNDYVVSVVSRTASNHPAIEGATVTLTSTSNITRTQTTDHNGLALFENLPNGSYTIKVTRDGLRDLEFLRTKDSVNHMVTAYMEPAPTSDAPYIMSVTGIHERKIFDLRNNKLTLCERTSAELDGGIPAQALSLDIRVNWGKHGEGTVSLYPSGKPNHSKPRYLNQSTSDFMRGLYYVAEDFGAAASYYLVATAADGTKSSSYTINLKTEGAISTTTSNIVEFLKNHLSFPGLPEFMVGEGAPFMENSPFSFEMEEWITGNKVFDDGTTMGFAFGMSPDDYEQAYQTHIKGNPPASNSAEDDTIARKTFFSDVFRQKVDNVAKAVTGPNKDMELVKSRSKDLAEQFGARDVPIKTAIGDAMDEAKKIQPSISFGGYCQLERINGKWVIDELCITGCVEPDDQFKKALEKASITKQGAIGYVPVYFRIGLTGEAEASGKFGTTGHFTELTFGDFEISGTIGFEGEGGMGIARVATVGVGGSANLVTELGFDGIKLSMDDFTFNMIPQISAGITGYLHAQVKLLNFTIARVQTGNLLGDSFIIWPKTNAEAVSKMAALSFDKLDLSQPLLEDDLSYRQLDTVWMGDEIPISTFASFRQREERVLLSGIAPDTEAILTQFGNKQVLLWLADNTERADRDRSMLVYSVLDPELGNWSDPQPLWDNGFSDHLPVVQGDWVTWQKLNASAAGDAVSINDVAKLTEVAAAHWNGTGFDTPVYLTENAVLDAQPVVASLGNQTSIVWTQNSADNLLGLEGTNSVLFRTLLEDGSWSEAITLTEGRKAITSLSAAYDASGLRVAINEETDNSLDTVDDRSIILFTVDGQSGTTEQTLVTSALQPQLVYLGDTLNLFYHQNQTIYQRTDLSAAGVGSATLAPGSITADTFHVASNASGSAVLLWSSLGDSSVEVFGAYYDGESWSPDIQFSSGASRATRPTGIFHEDSTLDLAYIRTVEVHEGTENSETATSVTTVGNLCTLQIVPACDLAVGTIGYDPSDVIAGTELALNFNVLNRGELAVDAVQAHIYTEDKSIDTTLTLENSALEIGELKNLSASVPIPAQLPYQQLTVDILPMLNGKVDLDLEEEDNRSTSFLGGSDLVLSPMETIGITSIDEETESFQLWASVTNNGLSASKEASAFLRYGGMDGPILAVHDLGSLAVGDTTLFSFTLDLDRNQQTEVDPQITITVSCEDEQYEGNNRSTLRLERTQYSALLTADSVLDNGNGTITVSGTLLNETEKDYIGLVYAAVYNADGRLIGLDLSQTITLSANSSQPVPRQIQLSEDWGSGCTVKLLFLEQGDMNPLTECALYAT